MGVDALIATLERDGRARAEAIRAEARARAARIRADAQARLDRRLAEALRAEEARLRWELGGQVAAVRREARGKVLAARDALLERVFEAARGDLPREAGAPGVGDAFAARLRRALARLPDAVVIRCPSHLEATARDLVRERGDTRVEADPAQQTVGFRACAEDGSVEVDATLPRLLALHRPRLALEVLRALAARTGGEGPG